MPEPETYEEKVMKVFEDLCEKNPKGASAAEVTKEMSRRGWLSDMDTVIDIADIMKELMPT